MPSETMYICYCCGSDTKNSNGVCGLCARHGSRHTEGKDRPSMPHDMLFGDDDDDDPESRDIRPRC